MKCSSTILPLLGSKIYAVTSSTLWCYRRQCSSIARWVEVGEESVSSTATETKSPGNADPPAEEGFTRKGTLAGSSAPKAGPDIESHFCIAFTTRLLTTLSTTVSRHCHCSASTPTSAVTGYPGSPCCRPRLTAQSTSMVMKAAMRGNCGGPQHAFQRLWR